MLGWWEDTEQGNGTVPVQSTSPSLKVTVYLKKGVKALIVLADWDELSRDVSCTLTYDWDALGLDKASATLSAPLLPPFREPWPGFSRRCCCVVLDKACWSQSSRRWLQRTRSTKPSM